MKKAISILIILIGTCCFAIEQSSQKDRLMNDLAIANQDSTRVKIMSRLCSYYYSVNADSSLFYGKQALILAQKIKFSKGEVSTLRRLGFTTLLVGDIPEALKLTFKGLQISEENHFQYDATWLLLGIGDIYNNGLDDNKKALEYYYRAMSLAETLNPKTNVSDLINWIILNTGVAYLQIAQNDSALVYLQKAKINFASNKTMYPVALMFFGKLQFQIGNRQVAMENLQKSIQLLTQNNQGRGLSEAYNIYAGLFKEMNQPDSSIYYAKKGLEVAQSISYKQEILKASNLLSEEYKSTDIKEAYKYLNLAKTINEELYGAKKVQSLQKLISEEQKRQSDIEAENLAYQNRLRMNAFLGTTFTLIVIAIFLFILSRRKQKAKQKIESAFNQLKATQSQLIQSEKMASLGELTAGIAHEIQNPLNFVNNFSEVNKELITEMKEEIANKNFDDVIAIANDIEENEGKILHHGKRADAIVKGMLQHSRTSSGVKEPTEINALADEYLRLAYHGLRAKDKSFNATMNTNFDESIGQINIVPQDIGRVILNLINNAFYAVDEKKKSGIEKYEPTVSISTKKTDGKVEIKVSDNGNGIPQKVIDKIFQPFFTTKPTGQGTGLGLSLSYDIVKAHGGEIKVESTQGEGSEFIILLPINQVNHLIL